MQEILKKRIENFAKLIVKKGVNVQQGQEVVISAELDQPEFYRVHSQRVLRSRSEKGSCRLDSSAVGENGG